MKYQRLQDLREDNDMTQAEFSEILHVSQRAYSYYETGTRQLSAEMLIRIAEYYKTSVDYLLGLTDEKKPYPRKNDPKNPSF
ncbi:MAG: helix-turn-helix transcriptional regulator [Eubacterium sp.]|nr:helix-turn-helix transcriptional regulator [Eubacterium sp.]